MLVILLEDRVIKPASICTGCPLANQQGEPRWQGEQLRCGRPAPQSSEALPATFECAMGFRVVRVS